MSPPTPPTDFDRAQAARALLHWYADMGIDVAVQNAPLDYFSLDSQPPRPLASGPPAGLAGPAPQPAAADSKALNSKALNSKVPGSKELARPITAPLRADASQPSADEAIALARQLAAAATSIEMLAETVARFDGCPLRKGARKTVFAAGVTTAPLLVLGEAPGQDEDRMGAPFVGRAGQLLDRMLAAIGHSRETNTYISNVIYWRPPGNRTPTDIELAICKPFVDRLIELQAPQVIMVAGAVCLKSVLGQTGIMKTRGKWQALAINGREIPVMPTFHPAYLLRNPEAKRLVWQDLQALHQRLGAN